MINNEILDKQLSHLIGKFTKNYCLVICSIRFLVVFTVSIQTTPAKTGEKEHKKKPNWQIRVCYEKFFAYLPISLSFGVIRKKNNDKIKILESNLDVTRTKMFFQQIQRGNLRLNLDVTFKIFVYK